MEPISLAGAAVRDAEHDVKVPPMLSRGASGPRSALAAR